jgi:hypothetical protein
MSGARQVAGGGREIRVGVARLSGWFVRFTDNHGGAESTLLAPDRMLVTARDGASAEAVVPFAPLRDRPNETAGLVVEPLAEHMSVQRRVGLILVRRGAHSVGIALGSKVLVSSTDRHYVQGRTAAGGWSQQRFARRREGQARVAFDAAAADVRRVLLPEVASLDAVVLGGDRRGLDTLRADAVLRPVFALAEPGVLDIAEPRRRVLDQAAAMLTEVRIVIRENPVTSS